MILVQLLLLVSGISLAAEPPANLVAGYPARWWTPVPQEGAPAWEILPQAAGPGEVILSKRNELGLLSNFAPTPFTFRGKRYASMEGFWQAMKYPESADDPRAAATGLIWQHTRAEVEAMTTFEAKDAGKAAEENIKKMGIDWVTFEGQRLVYRAPGESDFYRLVVEAMRAKLAQNLEVGRVLLETGNLRLLPDHHSESPELKAWQYYGIWMKLRSELNPLASWNDPVRKRLLDWMARITPVGGKSYVPPQERVAVFDLDGTVLAESPYSMEAALTTTRLLAKLEKDRSLKNKPLYKAVSEKDDKFFDKLDNVLSKVGEAFSGETMDDYLRYLSEFYRTYRNPRFNRTYRELIYGPMVELIDWLQLNRFQVYVCSGTQEELLKVMADDLHLPPENMIGTVVRFNYLEEEGKDYFRLEPATVHPSSNMEFKPVRIFERIGRRPIFAMANSEKDREMLNYAALNPRGGLALVLYHDDIREAPRPRPRLLELARRGDWLVVSMKEIFKRIF